MDEASQRKVVVFQCGCGLVGINPASFLLNPDCSSAYAERMVRLLGVGKMRATCRLCGEPVRIGKVWKDTFLKAREDYFEEHPDMPERVKRIQGETMKDRVKWIKLIRDELVLEGVRDD